MLGEPQLPYRHLISVWTVMQYGYGCSVNNVTSLNLLPSTFPLSLRDKTTPSGKLSYKDFVWFLMSEEDKTTQRR